MKRAFACACLVVAVTLDGSGQPTTSPDAAREAAWGVLDSAWAAGHADRRFDILGALAKVESARATAVFRAALGGSPGLAAQAARMASEQRVAELLPEISARLRTEGDASAQIGLISCLRKLHSRAAADLVTPFAMEDREPVTGVAFGALSDLGSAAVPDLETILRQGRPKCRETAAYTLWTAAGDAAPAFREALTDADPRVQTIAAIALARGGDRSGAGILRAAASGPDIPLRVWSEVALYDLGQGGYRDALLKELAAADAPQRYFAAREMLRWANEPLRSMAQSVAQKDASPQVRSALLEMPQGTAGAPPALGTLLGDPDLSIRVAAAKKLLAVRPARPEADEALRAAFLSGSPDAQGGIVSALAGAGAPTTSEKEIILTALGSPSAAVQVAAANAMAGWGRDSVQWLAPVVGTTEEAYLLAATACGLAEVAPSEAIPILLRRLESPIERVRVISAGYLLYALEQPK